MISLWQNTAGSHAQHNDADFSARCDQEPLGSISLLDNKIAHGTGAQDPAVYPEILVLARVLILGGAKFGSQKSTAGLYILIHSNPVFQETRFHCDDLVAVVRVLVLHNGHLLGVLPAPLSLDSHALFAADNAVVENPWDLDLVTASRVCVKDHAPVLQ